MVKNSGDKLEEVIPDHPIIEKKIQKTLKLSVKEGCVANISTSLGPSYFAPFALAVGATAPQIGILSAFAYLLPGISQFNNSRKFKENKKKKIIVTRILLAYSLLLILAFTGFLFLNNFNHLVWAIIAIVGLYYYIIGPASSYWYVWMGTLVKDNDRAKYFSNRLKLNQTAGLIAMILSALFLDFMKRYNPSLTVEYTIYAFILLFFLSFLFRIRDVLLLNKHYEPHLKIKKKEEISFKRFLKEEPKTPFGKFVMFMGVFNLSMAIASPFFTLYMLQVLNFSYTWFIFTTIGAVLLNIVSLPLLRKISDKYGSIFLTKLSCFSISLIPLFWISTFFIVLSEFWLFTYVMLFMSILYGIGSAGLILVGRTYTYDANKTQNRKYAFPYLNLVVGIGAFIGSLLGALLAFLDINLMGSSLLIIFIVSFVFRIVSTIVGSKNLHEVRKTDKFKAEYFIRDLKPFHSLNRGSHRFGHHNYEVVHHI